MDADGVDFWTIEVVDGADMSALRWKDAHGESVLETALTHGAKDWSWVIRSWGVLLELGFADESDWLRFRATPAVQAALDAVPDPVSGLFVYSGRGGSSGAPVPRRPRPRPQAGGAIPEEPPIVPGDVLLGRRSARPADIAWPDQRAAQIPS